MIETVQLRLVPYSAAHMLALIEGEDAFAERFGISAANGLRAFFVSDEVSPVWREQLYAARNEEPDPWAFGFAIIHRESRLVIGSVGFREPPDATGIVEMGYGVVADYQKQGFATDAVRAVLAWVFDTGLVHRVRAHIRATNTASRRVLVKCGFAFVGEVEDPEDGIVERWEHDAL